MADVSSDLQDFRDRERLYNQKAVHQYMQNEQLNSIKWLLTMIFYLVCIAFVYFIYTSNNSTYLKVFYITLALAYPFYIFYLESVFYSVYLYIVAFIRGIPTERL